MIPKSVWSNWGRLLVATLLALFALATGGSLSAWVAHAEGSRDLYPSGASGFRANLEWRTSYYGPNFLRRRTLLQVYAEPGEVILVGSSAVGVDAGDIQIFSSDQVTGRVGDETVAGPADFSCETQRAATGDPDQGRISTRDQELAGPDTVPGAGVSGGYVPCYYEVPTDGTGSSDNIYYVVFFGPEGSGSNVENFPSGRINLVTGNALDFGPGQNTSVSAWDVTVRSSLTSAEDITGRLFADYLTMITGATSRPMNSTLYVLTTDAYIYEVGLRGLDGYGFVVYSNDIGFLDSDGVTPLYHDVLADPTIPTQEQNQLNVLQGGVALAEPSHRVFFNEPSPEARLALNGLVDPIIPLINLFVFEGVLGGNDTLVGAGGTFDLDVNVRGRIDLVISRDGVDFDPVNPSNRSWRDFVSAGSQQIPWDGLDNAGNPFPVGSYPVRILLRAGEVHFPLFDVENSQEGGPQYELTNPPDGCPPLAGGCFTGFYDDRGYTTTGGTDVGTPGVALPGVDPPPIPNSDPLVGFDTRTDQRAFGDASQGGFGDKKGLDLWAFFPTQASTTLNILADTITITPTPTPTPTPTITITPTPTSTRTPPSIPPPTLTPTLWSTLPPPATPTEAVLITPTPAVLFLPETGDDHAPAHLWWLWLALPLLGLPAAWVIRCRRR